MSEDGAKQYETLQVERRGKVLVVTLDRPKVLNAFDQTMQEELRSVWRDLRTDDSVNAAVVTASGDRAFCVGIDRDAPMTAIEGKVFGTSNSFMYDDPGDDLGPKSCDLWKPVIAAVNGIACGGAFYILAECDIIIAAENATFFDPHVTYGMAAVYEPMKMMYRMGFSDVMRMSLLGAHEVISAATAERIGLVTEVVAQDALRDRAIELAETIANQPADAVQATLRAIWAASEFGPSQALRMAPSILANGISPAAMAEGQAVFESGQRIKPRVR